MTTYRSLARNRDFTALWMGATLSEVGTRVTVFAMPLVAYSLTGSALWAAAAEAGYLLGMLAALLPAGVLADRCHRLRVMQGTMAAGVVLFLSLAVAGILDLLTLPHLLAVAVLAGLAAGGFGPAETSAVRTVVTTEELPTALSQQQARQHVAALAGGPAGGALFGLARWAPFLADAASYAAGWLLLRRIRTDLSPRTAESSPRPLKDIGEGLGYIWRRPFFRTLLAWAPLANLAINALYFTALLRLISAGFPAWQIGLVEAALGACGILGALAAPRLIDRVPTGWLTIATAWGFVPVAIPLALWNHPIVMAAAGSIGMLLLPASNAGIGSYRMAVTPPELIGRTQSAMQFVAMLAMPLAPVLAGLLLGGLGGRDAVLALAGLTAAAALIPTLARSVRSVPRPEHWPDATAEQTAAQPDGLTAAAGAR